MPHPLDTLQDLSREELLRIEPPEGPADFAEFWRERHGRIGQIASNPTLRDTGLKRNGWRIHELSYGSTDGIRCEGWMLLPAKGPARRGFVVGHGYGGRTAPDLDLPLEESALLFPCARGLGPTRHRNISPDPQWHVLHNIEDRERYVHAGCVEDLWLAVSTLLSLQPGVEGHVGYLGISFGGGIGALALPWDSRVQRAHFNVPSFGHHPLRLRLPSNGSAASIQVLHRRNPRILRTLEYFDAATAARHLRIPVHCACALYDPTVPPAGQFAVYNALPGPKELFVLEAGHQDYPGQAAQNAQLRAALRQFFEPL